MKTTKQFLALAIAGLFFTACKDSKTESTVQAEDVQTEISAENLQTASFKIDGMHCEFGCAKGIEKKLAKLEGVQSATVDFETKEATIEYDAKIQSPQILAEVVQSMDAKYIISDIKSSSDQSYLYFDQEQEKAKKAKKTKKAKTETTTTTEKPAEKKGCCSGKSSCSSKEKSGSL